MVNIAEILIDYPSGTKLYSPICGECELQCVVPYYCCGGYKIRCVAERNCNVNFDEFGRYEFDSGECLLFPSKDNRDWTNFGEPKYIDLNSSVVEMVKQNIEEFEKSMKAPISLKKGDFVVTKNNCIGIIDSAAKDGGYYLLCRLVDTRENGHLTYGCREYTREIVRLATEEERQKLLKVIVDNGYVWDSVENALVRKKENGDLKPFDKVLVRDYDCDEWGIDIFSNKTDNGQFQCIGNMWRHCVPYEENQELLGTCNKPNYK